MAADHVLREQTGDDSDNCLKEIPSVPLHRTRNQVGHTMNPFLVILAAEIKFRRYLAANALIYDSLMRKIIQVADLLYFLPADRGSAFRDPILIDMEAFHAPVDFVDAEMAFQQRRTSAGGGGGVRLL